MKTIISLLAGSLVVFMFSCQPSTGIIPEPEPPVLPEPEPPVLPEPEVPQYEVCEEDAERELSHEPTGVVDVETENQTVKIDFSLDEALSYGISFELTQYFVRPQVFEGDLFEAFPTVGKLAGYYNRRDLCYNGGLSSIFYFPYENGEIVYTKIEYLLAQECLRDDCCTSTRKAILQTAVKEHKHKMVPYKDTWRTRRTGMFLMAVVLVMEKDADFLTAILEKPDLQNILRLNLDWEIVMNHITSNSFEFDLAMCQFANNFLKNNQ